MRERVHFEVRLRRFAVWRCAVGTVAMLAVAASVAWAVLTIAGQGSENAPLVICTAAALIVATVIACLSLSRVSAGVLASEDGRWRYVAESGRERSGPLEVAIDLGSFLLLRLGERGAKRAWLPVQRRGLEREWHALRCAVYSPPPVAGVSPTAPSVQPR